MTPAQTPERPVTWSDEELRKALCALAGGWMAAATEFSEARRFLTFLGAVHPTEAREREREAWEASQAFMWGRSLAFKDVCVSGQAAASERDRLYPSLLSKSPPPLVLSSGEWVRRLDCAVGGRWKHAGGHWNAPECVTASDARKLAEWLTKYGSTEEAK